MAPPPLISALIPSYNHGRYIQETIASVLTQTVEDFELLILDDGSTDNSFDIIEDMARQDSRIKAWRQPNAGLIPTLNALMARARGTYVAQIDSDDAYLPERFAWGVEDMEHDPNLVASFCAYVCIDKGGRSTTGPQRVKPHTLYGPELIRLMVICNCVCACTGFMRNTALKRIGQFARRPYTLVHDWDRWLRLSLVGPMLWRPDIGARYRKHDANQSLQRNVSVDQQIAIGRAMGPRVIRHHSLEATIEARYHSQLACLLLEQEDPAGALEQLVAKSRLEPFFEHESIWFLQCMTLSGHEAPARRFAATLQRSREKLQPLARRQLDEVQRALGNAP